MCTVRGRAQYAGWIDRSGVYVMKYFFLKKRNEKCTLFEH